MFILHTSFVYLVFAVDKSTGGPTIGTPSQAGYICIGTNERGVRLLFIIIFAFIEELNPKDLKGCQLCFVFTSMNTMETQERGIPSFSIRTIQTIQPPVRYWKSAGWDRAPCPWHPPFFHTKKKVQSQFNLSKTSTSKTGSVRSGLNFY